MITELGDVEYYAYEAAPHDWRIGKRVVDVVTYQVASVQNEEYAQQIAKALNEAEGR